MASVAITLGRSVFLEPGQCKLRLTLIHRFWREVRGHLRGLARAHRARAVASSKRAANDALDAPADAAVTRATRAADASGVARAAEPASAARAGARARAAPACAPRGAHHGHKGRRVDDGGRVDRARRRGGTPRLPRATRSAWRRASASRA